MAKGINAAQMAFDFSGAAVARMPKAAAARHDLFFALVPDAETAERVFRLACDLHRQHELAARPRPLPLLHMTLCGVGEIAGLPDNAIDRAIRAADGVGGAGFAMNLDQILTFKQAKHPFVLCAEEGNDAFRMLHIRLGLALRNSGFKVGIQRGLTPHMTLAYGRKPVPAVKLVKPIGLRATEFVLIRSHHGEGRHEHLSRWPLPPAEPRRPISSPPAAADGQTEPSNCGKIA